MTLAELKEELPDTISRVGWKIRNVENHYVKADKVQEMHELCLKYEEVYQKTGLTVYVCMIGQEIELPEDHSSFIVVAYQETNNPNEYQFIVNYYKYGTA